MIGEIKEREVRIKWFKTAVLCLSPEDRSLPGFQSCLPKVWFQSQDKRKQTQAKKEASFQRSGDSGHKLEHACREYSDGFFSIERQDLPSSSRAFCVQAGAIGSCEDTDLPDTVYIEAPVCDSHKKPLPRDSRGHFLQTVHGAIIDEPVKRYSFSGQMLAFPFYFYKILLTVSTGN